MFYACPIELERDEREAIREQPIGDILRDLSKDTDRFRAKTPIRFDFDIDAANPNHSASHLTMINNECRLPVFGPIDINHFIRFIFKNFYPDVWQDHEHLRNLPLTIERRTITGRERRDLHLWAAESDPNE